MLDLRDDTIVRYLYSRHLHGGGGQDEILLRFGLSEREFFSRATILLEEKIGTGQYSSAAINAMQRVCRARLWVMI